MTDRLARSTGRDAFRDGPVDRTEPGPASGVGAWIRRHPAVATALLMLGTALVLRAFSYTSAGLDWDESLYIVIAQRWLQGGVPYLAIWDQHPMGLPALFAAAQW